jgi:hypothetical protein
MEISPLVKKLGTRFGLYVGAPARGGAGGHGRALGLHLRPHPSVRDGRAVTRIRVTASPLIHVTVSPSRMHNA